MDQLLQSNLANAAVQIERQLDDEIDKLDNLNIDDIHALREKRLKELKEGAKKKQEWLANVS